MDALIQIQFMDNGVLFIHQKPHPKDPERLTVVQKVFHADIDGVHKCLEQALVRITEHFAEEMPEKDGKVFIGKLNPIDEKGQGNVENKTHRLSIQSEE